MFKLILRSRFKLSRVCCVQPFNTSFQIRACQDSRTARTAIQLYFNCLATMLTSLRHCYTTDALPVWTNLGKHLRDTEPQWVTHYKLFYRKRAFNLRYYGVHFIDNNNNGHSSATVIIFRHLFQNMNKCHPIYSFRL